MNRIGVFLSALFIAILTNAGLGLAVEVPIPTPAPAKPEAKSIWADSVTQAKEQAKKEGKTVMIIFIGSDFDSGILKTTLEKSDKFKKGIEDQKVIPVIVICQNKSSDMSKEDMDEIKKVFLSAVPTVMLTDTDGHVFGVIRKFSETSLDQSKELVDSIAQFNAGKAACDEMFKNAAKQTGTDKAELLNAGLGILQTYCGCFDTLGLFGYEDVLDEMAKSDVGNKGGFAALADYKKTALKFAMVFRDDISAAHAMMDQLLTRWPKDKKVCQNALMLKAKAFALSKDFDGTLKALAKIIEIDPKSTEGLQAAEISASITKIKADQEAEEKDGNKDVQQIEGN